MPLLDLAHTQRLKQEPTSSFCPPGIPVLPSTPLATQPYGFNIPRVFKIPFPILEGGPPDFMGTQSGNTDLYALDSS